VKYSFQVIQLHKVCFFKKKFKLKLIFLGYWNNKEATEKVFNQKIIKKNGSNSEPIYLRTGDLGFVHKGKFFYF
jgi:acyl-CoA synthetase (AMP-forming)/AMP-acid ligase II